MTWCFDIFKNEISEKYIRAYSLTVCMNRSTLSWCSSSDVRLNTILRDRKSKFCNNGVNTLSAAIVSMTNRHALWMARIILITSMHVYIFVSVSSDAVPNLIVILKDTRNDTLLTFITSTHNIKCCWCSSTYGGMGDIVSVCISTASDCDHVVFPFRLLTLGSHIAMAFFTCSLATL